MIRVGIVGTGGMGTVHYTNYQYIEECQVAAVCGNREKAEKWGVNGYSDITEMIQSEHLDVVDICTPTFLHYAQAKEALKYCSVICEKPLAFTRAEGEELVNTAKKYGHHLYVGQVLRFFPEYKVLKQVIEEQTCGKMLDGYFWRLSAKPKWTSGGWLTDKTKSGLLPFDLHIHDLDFLVSILGIPENQHCTSAWSEKDGMAQQYRFLYEFDHKGQKIYICAEAAWFNGEYPWSAGYRVCFEHGVLESREGKAILYQEGKDPQILDTSEKRKIPTGINIPPTGVYLEELEHFIECMQKDKDSDMIRYDQVLGVLGYLEEINEKL